MNEKKDAPSAGQNQGITLQDEIVFRLKSGIDNNRRYKYPLRDMAMGLAAGKGVTQPEAKKQIEDMFTQRVGSSPYDYLQSMFDQNRDPGRGSEMRRGRGR